MANGQQIDSGQGSVTYSRGDALSGAEATGGAGSAAGGALVGLRSRKVGGGAATHLLAGLPGSLSMGAPVPTLTKTPAGSAFTAAAGSLGKLRERALTGTAVTVSAGTMAASSSQDPTWVGLVPSVPFTQGVASTYSLTQHTLNFNPTLHSFELLSGSLPSGVTLNATSGYSYDGSGAVSSQSGIVIRIANNAGLAETDWLTRSTATGVTYKQDCRTASEVTPYFFANAGDTVALNHISRDTTDGIAGTNGACIRIITPRSSVYAGRNSAVFRHPLNSAWTSNSQHFGTTPFWMFWRMKIDANRLLIPTAGWKFFNLAQFNFSGTPLGDNSASNTTAEIVGQDSFGRGFPQAYYQNGQGFVAFEDTIGAGIRLQNAIDNGSALPNADRYCLYSGGDGTAGCFEWPVDEWISMKARVKFGTYGGSSGNEFDMWIAPRDATSWTKTHSFSGFTLGLQQSGYGGSNGMHWHFYETGRENQTVTVDTVGKITQIIVSTSDIALPAVGA